MVYKPNVICMSPRKAMPDMVSLENLASLCLEGSVGADSRIVPCLAMLLNIRKVP